MLHVYVHIYLCVYIFMYKYTCSYKYYIHVSDVYKRLSNLWIILLGTDTCSEVNDNVDKKDSVRETVEDYVLDAEVVVEEGDGDRQNDEIGQQQQQHKQIPVEPTTEKTVFMAITRYNGRAAEPVKSQ